MSGASGEAGWIESRPAGARSLAADLREVWSYHELASALALRDLQLRYKQTAFGVAWSVLQPLAAPGVHFRVRKALAAQRWDPLPVFASPASRCGFTSRARWRPQRRASWRAANWSPASTSPGSSIRSRPCCRALWTSASLVVVVSSCWSTESGLDCDPHPARSGSPRWWRCVRGRRLAVLADRPLPGLSPHPRLPAPVLALVSPIVYPEPRWSKGAGVALLRQPDGRGDRGVRWASLDGPAPAGPGPASAAMGLAILVDRGRLLPARRARAGRQDLRRARRSSSEGLGKRYRLGEDFARYLTLRESLTRRSSGTRGSASAEIWALRDLNFAIDKGRWSANRPQRRRQEHPPKILAQDHRADNRAWLARAGAWGRCSRWAPASIPS